MKSAGQLDTAPALSFSLWKGKNEEGKKKENVLLRHVEGKAQAV